MKNIIDSLVMQLGLDDAEWQRGQQKASDQLDNLRSKAQKTADAIDASQSKSGHALVGTGRSAEQAADTVGKGAQRTERHMRRMDVAATGLSKSFSAFGVAGAEPFLKLALGAGSAITAILAVRKVLDSTYATAAQGAAVGRMAFQSGIDVKSYAAWGNAMASVGGSASEAESSLSSLAQQQQMMRITGAPSQALQTLLQLGISPVQNPTQIMRSLASNQRLRSMPPAMRNSILQGMIGLDPTSAYAIEQGPAYVNKLLATQTSKGNITAQDTKTMQDFYTASNNLGQAFAQLTMNLELDIMPGLTEFITVLTGWVNWLDNKFPAWFHSNVVAPAQTTAGAVNEGMKRVANKPFAYTLDQQASIDEGMTDLQKAGVSRSWASGMLASAQRESGFDPTKSVIDTDGKRHVGLFMWSPERRAAILAATGIDVANASAAQQYKAALWEVNNLPQYAALKEQMQKNPKMSPQRAAGLWTEYYERPANMAAEMQARGQIATNIYNGALDPRKQPPDASTLTLSQRHPPVVPGPQASVVPRDVYQRLAAAGGDHRKVSTSITTHVTVNAPSGDPHQIARATVQALREHHGSQIGGSLQ